MTRQKAPPVEAAEQVPDQPAEAAPVKLERPKGGGRFVRQADGSLKKVEG